MTEQLLVETVRNAVIDAMAQRTPSPWLDNEGAAAYLGCTPGTMKTWRARGEGPNYRVVNGKMVRYHVGDLDAYVRGEVAR